MGIWAYNRKDEDPSAGRGPNYS